MTTTACPSNDSNDRRKAEFNLFIQANAKDPEAWPVCQICGYPHHETEFHWLYGTGTCDTCGTTMLEGTVRKFLNARSDKAATKALRDLENRSVRRRRPSMRAIKAAAQRRVDACAMAERLELDVQIVLPK
jgi:hypothetical protein